MNISPALIIFLFGLIVIAPIIIFGQRQKAHRTHAIKTFPLPPGCMDKFRQHHPDLNDADCAQVELGLRQFFLAWLTCGTNFIAMPSQVVDDLWHEFILATRAYEQFCQQAFGKFLHHSPAATLSDANEIQNGLRMCWQHVCVNDEIDPNKPTHLPRLFALDHQLNIENGFHYTLKPSGAETNTNITNLLAAGALLLVPVSVFATNKSHGRKDSPSRDGGGGCGGSCSGGYGGGCGGD